MGKKQNFTEEEKTAYSLNRRQFLFQTSYTNVYGSIRESNKQKLVLSTFAIGAMFVVKDGMGGNISFFEEAMYFISNICFIIAIGLVVYAFEKEAESSVTYMQQYAALDDDSEEAQERIKKIGRYYNKSWKLIRIINIIFVFGIIFGVLFAVQIKTFSIQFTINALLPPLYPLV